MVGWGERRERGRRVRRTDVGGGKYNWQ